MTEDKKLPTDKELIKFYTEKLELLQVRAKYLEYDTLIAELTARKYEALAKIAYIQNSQSKKEEDGNKSTSS